MVYGDFDGPGLRKNKANSKPNKANFGCFTAENAEGAEFLMCKNSRWCSWLGDFVSSAFFANSAVDRI